MANTTNIDLVKPAGNDHALISVLNGNSDKIDAEAGRQRGNFAGTYSTTSGYAVGDYCIYQGNLYRCTTAIGSSGENWTAAHWTQTKAGTELKGLSGQIATNLEFLKAVKLDGVFTYDIKRGETPNPCGILIFGYQSVDLIFSASGTSASIAHVFGAENLLSIDSNGRLVCADNNRTYLALCIKTGIYLEKHT